jgi:hypothetical protein
MCRYPTIILLLAVSLGSAAQDFGRWERAVDWDRVTHWSKYLISQAAYQGPNSLPVPRTGNGSIDSISSISATANFHFSSGDNTQNLALYANYCLVKDVISFDAYWVPYEHFNVSDAVQDQRHVFALYYEDHSAVGDLQINTNFQLLKKWRPHLQLALRMGYRFPCGTGFGAARYTDGPGYSFDLSYGKPLGKTVTWIGMIGFYSWQLTSVKHRQDDAFLFSNGLEINTKTVRVQTYVAGYLGYLEKSGDKPVVARATMEKKFKHTSLLLGFQQGLHDFKYTSGEFGVKWRL